MGWKGLQREYDAIPRDVHAQTWGVVLAFFDGVSSAAGASADLFSGLFVGIDILCVRYLRVQNNGVEWVC